MVGLGHDVASTPSRPGPGSWPWECQALRLAWPWGNGVRASVGQEEEPVTPAAERGGWGKRKDFQSIGLCPQRAMPLHAEP